MPRSLNILDIRSGDFEFTGSWSGLPPGIGYVNLPGKGPNNYPNSVSFTSDISFFLIEADSMPTADVDRLLIDLSQQSWVGNNKLLTIRYCEARSSASDAAVSSLEAQGVTISLGGIRPLEGGDVVYSEASNTRGLEHNQTTSDTRPLTSSQLPFKDGDLRYIRVNEGGSNNASALTLTVEAGKTYTINGATSLRMVNGENAVLQYNGQTDNWDVIGGNLLERPLSYISLTESTSQNFTSSNFVDLTIWDTANPTQSKGNWFHPNAAEIRPAETASSNYRYRISGHVNFSANSASNIFMQLTVDGIPTGRQWYASTAGAGFITIDFEETTTV
ncbi:MAG: hypothetical protein AAFU03_18720, partial [Bacteroidota bacterium]